MPAQEALQGEPSLGSGKILSAFAARDPRNVQRENWRGGNVEQGDETGSVVLTTESSIPFR